MMMNTMTDASQTSTPLGREYVAGTCNIGREEIAARRRFGHLGLAVTVGFAIVALVLDLPRELRLLVFLPAAGAAMGYLQAAFHFCAGFGMRGVYNFGRLGRAQTVADEGQRARDRRRALQLVGLSVLGGVAAALILALS
jgi:hypothetical protein